tara:strand:- start:1111 stop:1437 length:327 start_codon:yes stop_codon:yes gene_type:complete
MFLKKVVSVGVLLILLSGCAQNTASLLGPAYTLGTTGNAFQAGLSYGSDKAVTKITGKSLGKNVEELLKKKTKDQKTQDQESLKKNKELQELLKIRITEARKKLNLKN